MLKTIFHIITSCLAEQNIAVRENSTFFMQKKAKSAHSVKERRGRNPEISFFISRMNSVYISSIPIINTSSIQLLQLA